jgi:bacterioferritin (cytochrome b1)
MEYVLGSVITLAILLISSKLFRKELTKDVRVRVLFNQTRKYELIRHTLPFLPIERKKVVTQSVKHNQSVTTRILFIDGKAYWLESGVLQEAEMLDGNLDRETQKVVDIISMDDVELKKMVFVVEKLTEGIINDSGTSGN